MPTALYRWVPCTLLAMALAACAQPSAPAADTTQPLDTSPQKLAVGDTSEPVVSGNTPAAADIAAVAALNARFDPARDPATDLETAKVEAQRGGKRIVLDVGSEGCARCHVLDVFVGGDAQIRSFRDANYVWMKVDFSGGNGNAAFLSGFPVIQEYPHLFVLDAQGQLLHSQASGELEKGDGYDRAKFSAFLRHWAPAGS